jgi:hypothetical protein
MSEVVESGDEPAEEGPKFGKGEGDRLWSRSGVRPEARRGAGKVSHSYDPFVEAAMVVAG